MIALLFLVALFASSAVAGAQSLQPAGWDAGLKLAEAADTNPDPKIVEIALNARVEALQIVPCVRTNAWS